MSELKPCPFCGGEARLYPSEAGFFVGCFNDGCAVNPSSGEFVADGVWDEEQKEAAIDGWNTRAERTCHVVPHGYCIANGEKSCCRCWSCSECSYGWHVSDYDRQYRYCPKCGAKVVEG